MAASIYYSALLYTVTTPHILPLNGIKYLVEEKTINLHEIGDIPAEKGVFFPF